MATEPYIKSSKSKKNQAICMNENIKVLRVEAHQKPYDQKLELAYFVVKNLEIAISSVYLLQNIEKKILNIKGKVDIFSFLMVST